MKQQRLVLTSTQQEALKTTQSITLTDEQLHYLKRVLRLGEGETFIAMTGKGQQWVAALHQSEAWLTTAISNTRELDTEVSLGIAMPKGAGMENIIRQATELGVHHFFPLFSDRSFLHPGAHKLQRWRKIAQEAAELSCRSRVPTLAEPVPLAQVLELHPTADRYIGVTHTDTPHLLSLLPRCPAQVFVITGPEGGWSGREELQALDRGWIAMSLGRGVLSATTAPVIALAIISAVSHQP